MRYIVFVLSLIWLGAAAQAPTSFSKEPEPFVKELGNFLNATKREDSKTIAEQFTANYKAGKFTPEQMTAIIKTSNVMLGQKLRASPHFNDYISALNNAVTSGVPAPTFTKWTEMLDKVLTNQRRGSSKDFTAFIDFSNGLFSQNAIYSSAARVWKSTNKSYTLEYANDQPRVVFPIMDLIGSTGGDSITIKNTEGIFYPLDQKWEGKGGTVNWAKAGFKPEEVYAEIKTYTIDVTKSEYKIDSVTFFHKALFKESLLGSFADKLTPQKSATGFPLFISYRKDIKINDLGPNVKFEGGFSLAGSEIMGTGDSVGRASLSFYQDNGKKVVQAWSKNIILKKGVELSANDAQVSLMMGTDSIYHPGLTLKYKMEKKELALYTGTEGIAAATFYDSYHQKEIKADVIIWNLNEQQINVKMMTGAGKSPVNLTSVHYFQKGQLEQWQGAMDFNPVSVIKMYSDKNQTREIDAGLLAKAMSPGYTESTIKRLLYKLVENGFIFYDEDKSLVTVKEKVFNYVYANADKMDYDAISINSYSTQTNGKINLANNDILLTGVDMVVLSDSQDVRIFPGDKDTLIVKKEQDLLFSNIVIAGIIDFKGKGFYFDYDSFKIDLTDLAAATINVPTGEKDKDGDAIFVPLKSRIEGLTGFLEIDKPDNKSGRKPNPAYPIFTNRKKSYVYYYKKEIEDSAYIADKFYFELEPFQFDSLQSFDPYKSDLNGQLVSADIFPNFKEKLKIQPDLSLGFQRVTPDAGFDIYKGKGHYNDSIMLSDVGLRGKGRVKYLFTGFESDSILFTPDSLNAISDTFNMKKTTHQGFTYPMVAGKDNDIHWLPYRDSMYIRMRTTPFVMYEEGTSLKGNLLLTAKGLKGEGSFEFKEAVLTSTKFNFQSESLDADTMGMQIKSIDENRVTFNTPNVKGKVDFTKRIGEFKSNEKDIATEFTNNYYKTEINEFFWDMDANILDFKVPAGSEGSYFTSTKAGQDSLKFLSKRAIFNMSTSIINVSSVPEIRVADASIVPASGKATIKPGGLLDTLKNAVVIADTINKSHRIHSATIIIDSKKSYHGSGQYDYVNGKNKQEIAFYNISVKQEGEKKKATFSTMATTTIEEEDTFHLNNGIRYKGTANLQADKQFLSFEGFAKLDIKDARLDTSESAWFNVKDEVDPNKVTLHYSKLLSDKGDTLFAGIGYAMLDSVSFYPSLMRRMKNPDDQKTFQATGVVQYDDATKMYTFGDEEKIKTGGKYGNTMTYDTDKKVITAEGTMNLGLDFEPVKLLTTGNIVHEIDSNKYVFNTLIAMKLPIDKLLMEQFGKDVTAFSFDKPNPDYASAQFQAALTNTMDNQKAGTKFFEEMTKSGGVLTKAKSLGDYNLVMSNVALLYDANYQIFRSVGPVTFSFIGETGIHKQLEGFVEFGMRQDKDFFNIYIESTFDDWYFISYHNNTMQIGSSKEDFNKLLAAIPADKRKIKLKDEEFFFYTIGTFQNMQKFLQRMNLIASGVKVDYEEPTEEDMLEDELEQLKKELMEEENQDNPDGAGDVPSDEPAPSNTGDVAPDSGPKAPKPMLKEMENYEEGGKKKKGKKKEEDTEYIYDMGSEDPVEQEKPQQVPVQKEEPAPTPVEEEKKEEPVAPKEETQEPPKDTTTPVTPPVEEPKKKKGKGKTEDPGQPKAQEQQEPIKQEGADYEAAPKEEQVVAPPVQETQPKVVPVSNEAVKEELKVEEKKEEPVKEEPKAKEKKEKPKKEEPKAEEPKKEETSAPVEEKKEEVKTEPVKTDEPKTDEIKPEGEQPQGEVKPEGTTPEGQPTTQPEEKGKKKKEKGKKEETKPEETPVTPESIGPQSYIVYRNS